MRLVSVALIVALDRFRGPIRAGVLPRILLCGARTFLQVFRPSGCLASSRAHSTALQRNQGRTTFSFRKGRK